MISLFIDTCDTEYIVSIIKDNETLFFFKSENSKDLSTKLLKKIDEAFHSINLSIQDVDKIFVTNGPGSFTGIRVGVTVAKTLAYSLNKDIYTISRLECMASTKCNTDIIVPYIDARRDYVFAGIYDQNLNCLMKDNYLSKDCLLEKIKDKKVTFISCQNLIDGSVPPNVDVVKILEHHKSDSKINPHSVKPNYLKKTEAEENRDKGNN